MQATSTKQHKVRCCIPLSWNFDRWAAWQLGLYCSTGNISCCYYVYCHSAYSSSVQPNTVHTGKLPPLQYNPDTKASPTNLLFDRKCLLSPFIALCLTPPVILLERHHQSWTKQKAKVHQRRRQQKYYCRNNSTDGAKNKPAHGVVTCRGTAATTSAAGRVSPRLTSIDATERDCSLSSSLN